jgi:hypothetical protein
LIVEGPRDESGRGQYTSNDFGRFKDNVFQLGRHYYEVPYDEWSQWVNVTSKMAVTFLPELSEGPGGYRRSLIVLTERGYLRQAMCFTDELSRLIGEHILDVYFEVLAVNNHLKLSALVIADASRCTAQPGSASGSR